MPSGRPMERLNGKVCDRAGSHLRPTETWKFHDMPSDKIRRLRGGALKPGFNYGLDRPALICLTTCIQKYQFLTAAAFICTRIFPADGIVLDLICDLEGVEAADRCGDNESPY
jgi:hypothetical protein